MRKRILSLFLVAVMLVSMVAAYPMTVSAEGDADLVISSYEDLKKFDEAVDGGETYSNKKVVIAADIELDENWTGIGAEDYKKFCGEFDGRGHTITLNSSSKSHGGLFQHLGNGANIHDINLDGNMYVSDAAGSNYIGALATWAGGNVSIRNVVVSVDITDDSQTETGLKEFVGGFLAGIDSTSGSKVVIENCLYDGEMVFNTRKAFQVGGFFGCFYNGNGANVTIKNSVFAGKFVFNNTHSQYIDCVGGFVGRVHKNGGSGSDITVNIEDSISMGEYEVSCSADLANGGANIGLGAFAGWQDNGTLNIRNSYYLKTELTSGNDLATNHNTKDSNSTVNVEKKTADELLELEEEDLFETMDFSCKEKDGEIKFYPCPTGLAPTDGTWLNGLTFGFVISTYADMKSFANSVNNGGNTYAGQWVVLNADITIEDGWAGIGKFDLSAVFSGVFDGRGHTITLNDVKVAPDNGAIFNMIDGATLRNFNVNGRIYLCDAEGFRGGVVGTAQGRCLIENIHNSIDFEATGYNTMPVLGGFIGSFRKLASSDITFEQCVFDGIINVSNYTTRVGGFVGSTHADSTTYKKNVTFNSCVYAGTINLNDIYSKQVGGFVGLVYQAATAQLNDCYSIGKINFNTRNGYFDYPTNAVAVGEYGSEGSVTLNKFYYTVFGNGMENEGTALVVGSDELIVANKMTQKAIAELTAADFSPSAELSFKENAVDLYMPCPTGLVPESGWLDVLTIDYDGARVLGAQIRCTDAADQYSGIRFVTVFEKSAVENAGSADANFGIVLISLAKYNALDDKTSVAALEATGVKVAATKCDEDSDTYTVKAVVYNIDAENYRDDIVAVAYIGDTVIDTATRSIFTVAELCAADATASEAARDFSQKVIANAPAAN